jgi:hypothetical protein
MRGFLPLRGGVALAFGGEAFQQSADGAEEAVHYFGIGEGEFDVALAGAGVALDQRRGAGGRGGEGSVGFAAAWRCARDGG